MGQSMQKIVLLGAFEIQTEAEEAAHRDGLILGSRRSHRGFVIETSRELIEQIVQASVGPYPVFPPRLAANVGSALKESGCELKRVELLAVPTTEAPPPEGGRAAFVQGALLYRLPGATRARRLLMSATEAIQLAVREELDLLAAPELLQLNVGQFMREIDAFAAAQAQETTSFRDFVDSVKASDFTRFYQKRRPDSSGESEPG